MIWLLTKPKQMVINDETLASFINKGCVTLWPCHLRKMYLKAKEEL